MMATRPGGQVFASCDEGRARCLRRKGWFLDGLGFSFQGSGPKP